MSATSNNAEKPAEAETPAVPAEKPKGYYIKFADDPYGDQPDFIYGGPFVRQKGTEPLLDIATPVNLPHSGAFKKSHAYRNLQKKIPAILDKIIESKKGGAEYTTYVEKLKSEIEQNKHYPKFTVETKEAEKWNEWIDDQQATTYYTNSYLFTECYIYRRLREGAELHPLTMEKLDPFSDLKAKAFETGLEPMCILGERMGEMLQRGERDKTKMDYMTLLKLCAWANRCDLSFSRGEEMALLDWGPNKKPIDPFQMLVDLKDKLYLDDSGKSFENLCKKRDKIRTQIEAKLTKPFKERCSCERFARLSGWPIHTPPEEPPPPPPEEGAPPPPKIPCLSKLTVPREVNYDIVCDNVGYELFTDLCFAAFIIEQELVDKVRFHVKKYPWFVSDVTMEDFKNTISQCQNASYSRTAQPEQKPPPKGSKVLPPLDPPMDITSEGVRSMGKLFAQLMEEGKFLVTAEDFWTYPHPFKDMKRIDPCLYRKLQFSAQTLYKGDLNYRKLLAERNTNPYTKILEALQGYIPCAMVAARAVKSLNVCGMKKGKFELFSKTNEEWYLTGDYAMVQFCPKAEPFKPTTTPCIDYGDTCFSKECPLHSDI